MDSWFASRAVPRGNIQIERMPLTRSVLAREVAGVAGRDLWRGRQDLHAAGAPRTGHVGAVRAGANGVVEVLAELGMVFADPRYPLADRAGHTGSSALGGGCGSPIATTQADRARELSDQEVALGVGLLLPPGVVEGARLLDVVFDLGEAAAVGGLGPLVEHLARVPERRLLLPFQRRPGPARGTRGQGGRGAARGTACP